MRQLLRNNSRMHEYSVALRITGVKLDLAELTSRLGLSPTQTRIAGERRSATSLWTESLWEYEVRPDGAVMWPSLEEGLKTLLLTFASRQTVLHTYTNEYSVFLWCGHFSSSFNGGPTFSADLLKRLGDFGVELWLDTYLSDETAEGDHDNLGGVYSASRALSKPERETPDLPNRTFLANSPSAWKCYSSRKLSRSLSVVPCPFPDAWDGLWSAHFGRKRCPGM
jgi:hypothetical protein